MFVENYFMSLERDIDAAEEALKSSLPDVVRAGLEQELRKLHAMLAALTGDEKSVLHQLRAKLRWRRKELKETPDTAKRRQIERDLKGIEDEIKREVVRTRKG